MRCFSQERMSEWARLGRVPCAAGAGAGAGFTLVEVALALAVIGFALVAIIGVLPLGMNVQRENREETIINHDAMVLVEALRSGARRFDELTKFVDAVWVSNFVEVVDLGNNRVWSTANIWGTTNIVGLSGGTAAGLVGLMCTPTVYLTDVRQPDNVVAPGFTTITNTFVILHMRALTGSAVEKPPQSDRVILEGAFSYRLEVQVVPYLTAAQFNPTVLPRALVPNLYEVRLTFRWPLLPDGRTGPGRQSFRTYVGGTLLGPIRLTPLQQLPFYFFDSATYGQPFLP
ncbi:MAG: hypothetical protein RMH97_05930 [Verrucomicrobiales bacterium]|nr:hypothetical protein [Verrucomicrobiales bacterium]